MGIRKIEVIDKVNNTHYYLPETVGVVIHPHGHKIRLKEHMVEGMRLFGIIYHANGDTDLAMKKWLSGS